MELFKPESLSHQITRFVNAAIYFVSLSIIIAVCAALLSGVVTANLAESVPTLENSGFMMALLAGTLIAYLIKHAEETAESLGGKIDTTFGKQLGADIKKWSKTAYNKSSNFIKEIRKKK